MANMLAPPTVNKLSERLSPNASQDEMLFQKWIRSTPWFSEFVKEHGEEPDLDTKDYNYRAAWKAGLQPTRNPYDGDRFHWPSALPTGEMLKSENHPTAWKEYFMRETGKDPDSLGLSDPKKATDFLKIFRGSQR